MGWSGGSRMAMELIEALEGRFNSTRDAVEAYRAIIDILEDHDCDTLNECLGESGEFDLAFELNYIENYGQESWDSWQREMDQ